MNRMLTPRIGWSLLDRDGVRHAPMRENFEDAYWTPIACGGGLNLPGNQSRNAVTCKWCIDAIERETAHETAHDHEEPQE